MKFKVYLTLDAQDDIFEIFLYIKENDSEEKAKHLLIKLEEAILNLGELPNKGHIPPELKRLCVSDYLEIHLKPYRIIYQVRKLKVFVHCVLDSRRSLQDLLQERLVR